jgi:GNAT superfamily N-acetyltransferase
VPDHPTGDRPLAYRPGREEDLDACARTWRAAVDDYGARLNQPPVPDDLGPLRRMLAHLLRTDPERYWVAEVDGLVAGFASASLREGLWFLAMLFVEPGLQSHGIGQALMDRVQAGHDVDPGGPAIPGPDDPLDSGIHTWGMCTDAAQPISNALYARRGIPPRIPAFRLVGEVRRWSALPQLPAGLEAVPFETLAMAGPDGRRRLDDQVDSIDRELIGSAHGPDHEHLVREGRIGLLVRERDTGRAVGYVYGSGAGRLGPMAALDPDLHPAILGVAFRETPIPGIAAAWIPGTADRAFRALLDAGLRVDGFPGLICWSRADHPFGRYVPISLAIV